MLPNLNVAAGKAVRMPEYWAIPGIVMATELSASLSLSLHYHHSQLPLIQRQSKKWTKLTLFFCCGQTGDPKQAASQHQTTINIGGGVCLNGR